MKILHLIDHMGLGGAQTIVKDFIEKQDNTYLFALRKSNNEIKFDKIYEKRLHFFDTNSRTLNFKAIKELKNYIKKNEIDILHVHLPKSTLIAYLLKKFYNLPKLKIIIHEHGPIYSNNFIYILLLKLISKKAFKFIAVSKKTKELLQNKIKIKEEKLELIYNYIDIKSTIFLNKTEKKELRESINFKPEDYLIGFAGRLSKVKHIETLIKSSAYLGKENIKILIIGAGEEKESLEKLAKIYKNIYFLGFRSDMKKIYQILDTIVLCSYSEASPMAFYESQIFGIPFIGSDVFAINEFIIDNWNGLLFPLENEKILAEKIKLIKNDLLLREKIIKNSLENIKKYDISYFHEKINSLYNSK